ncbi:MAG: choice-of-anchor J domain-containing protein [Myxococcota bacterium]
MSASLWGLALTGCPGDDISLATESGSTSVATGGGTLCTPGQQVSCGCPGGGSGAQVCASDGNSFGECMCAPALDSTSTTDSDPDTTTGSTSGPSGSSSSSDSSSSEDDDTSSSSSEGSSSTTGDCVPPCEPDQVCEMGVCIDVVCGIEGSYDPCLFAECPMGSVCLLDVVADPTITFCAVEGCADACDCPEAPAGFDADCEDLLGMGVGYCHIDCGANDACPMGMECFSGACAWTVEYGDCCLDNGTPGCDDAVCEATVCAADADCCNTGWDPDCAALATQACPDLCLPPDVVPQYGDCVNGLSCDAGQSCITGPEVGFCGIVGCLNDAECQPAPLTGNAPAACLPILPMDDACALDCSAGQTCPDGMVCFDSAVCVWEEIPPPPPEVPAYGDCIDNPQSTCQPGETLCLTDDAMAPTGGACSQACVDVMDCLTAPPTGAAPVTCGDLDGGGNECYLDCAGGQACPDGMACTPIGGGSACLWPELGLILDEDFEFGALRPGWTVIDVDGNTPNPTVDFVTDAFVVTDESEAGINYAAYSTSWYSPVGQADDWLVTPQITLGPASVLSWQAVAPDPMFPDGYEVRISTAGPTVADLLANPVLLDVPAEADAYTPRSVDLALAGYANQSVYLAFRNNSNDQFLLLIDDIEVTQ